MTNLKREAAQAAMAHVKPGMKLGIGTGSTAEELVTLLIEAVGQGLQITGVPTSERTRELCEAGGVPMSTLEEAPKLDLTIDGADEIDGEMRLIKGGGGALLREKIVASASDAMIVIADDSKLVDRLGAFALPIEVNAFGLRTTRAAVEDVCARHGCAGAIELRGGADPFHTDGGHLILDAAFGAIADPDSLADDLVAIPGVVDHGLFLGLATRALIAGPDGVMERTRTGGAA